MIKVANLNISQDNCGLYIIKLKGTDTSFFKIINNELWFTLQQPNICKTSYTVIVSVEDLAGRFTPLTRTFTLNTPNCFCTSTTTTTTTTTSTTTASPISSTTTTITSLPPSNTNNIILINPNEISGSRSVAYDARNSINFNNWLTLGYGAGMWLELENRPLTSAVLQSNRLWESVIVEPNQSPLVLYSLLRQEQNSQFGSLLYRNISIQAASDYLYADTSVNLPVPARARLRMSIFNNNRAFLYSVYSNYFDIRPTI